MGIFDFVKNAGSKIFGGKEDEKPAAEPQINYARQAYLKAQAEKAEAEQEAALESAKSAALLAMLENYGYDITRLNLAFDDGKVTITGNVDKQEELESIILLIGNTDGVGQVDAQVEVLHPTPPAVFYTVVKGDNLSKISKHFYGKSSRYREIFEANKPMLTDPDKIYPGQTLRIPQDNENVA